MIPPAWQPAVQLDNGVPAPRAVLETKFQPVGTQFPYGCRYCARSTSRDSVEFCDTVMGVVHADCHEDECGGCAWLLCNEDRCDERDECEHCWKTVCKRHNHTECVC